MAKTRDELIERLMAHQSGTNLAEMEKETILKLLRRMKNLRELSQSQERFAPKFKRI